MPWTLRRSSGAYSRRSSPTRRFIAGPPPMAPGTTGKRRPSPPVQPIRSRYRSSLVQCVLTTISASRGNAG
eukprot:1231385-Rhodomonas_salina.1